VNVPIVTSTELVSEQWLTDVLESGGAARGASVVGFEAETVGTGQMGENVRFRLVWDSASGRPESVVAKFPSANAMSRATGLATRSYEREVRFYEEVAASVDIRTPRCFHAEVNVDNGDFVLVMEDLAPRAQGDQLAGISPDRVSLVLEQLALLQVPRWNDASLHNIEWLSRREGSEVDALRDIYAAVLPGFLSRLGDRLSANERALVERFATKISAWAGGIARDHLVVTHGDFRLDNMMFGGGDGASADVVVVDWQGPGHGAPTADLAYFLGAGLLPEDRRRHEVELVRQYHDRLSELAAPGSDVRQFAYSECWQGYRRAAFGGIVMAVVASQLVIATERGDEMFLAMAHRHATHALDLESEKLI